MEKPLEELKTRHLLMKLRAIRKQQSLTRTDWDFDKEARDARVAALEVGAIELKEILKARENLPTPKEVRQEKAKFHQS